MENTKSLTDIDRVSQMKDSDIDFSDIPPVTEEMFRRAFRFRNFEPVATPEQTLVPIFNDVIEFFRKRQPRYVFEIDKVLRDFVASEQAKSNDSNG